MMQIKTTTLTINCALDGPVHAPAIMFSNSLAANLGMWQPQVERLKQDYRIVRYDTRGHGATEVPSGPYTMDQLVGDVVALLDALELERVHFVGLSMGGMTAQGLALAHPGRLRSMTVANSLGRVPPEAAQMWDDRIRIARESGMQALVEPTIARWFTPPTISMRGAEVDAVRAMIAATPVAGYAGACAAIKGLDYLDRLQRIQLPALFIAGTHDAAASPATMRDMQGRVQGSRFAELDAAHLSNIECADAFSTALVDFIRAVSVA